MKKIFFYLEPLWLGAGHKISIRRVLAIAFSIDFILNESYAIHHWGENRSFGELSSLMLIEAGLIAALLGMTTYSNMVRAKLDDSHLPRKSTNKKPIEQLPE